MLIINFLIFDIIKCIYFFLFDPLIVLQYELYKNEGKKNLTNVKNEA
jgi:hypothetical protein